MAEFAVLAELTAGVTIQATASAAVAPTAIRVSLICLAYPSSGTAISNRPAAGNALRVRAHGANGRGPTVAIDCGRKVHPKRGIAERKVPGRRMGGAGSVCDTHEAWLLVLGVAGASLRHPAPAGSVTVLPAPERVRELFTWAPAFARNRASRTGHRSCQTVSSATAGMLAGTWPASWRTCGIVLMSSCL